MRATRTLIVGLVMANAGCATPRAAPSWDPSSGAERPAEITLRVQGRAQRRSLSCESCSAADMARHLGFDVSEAQVLAGLPASDNPELGFVGDVDGPGEQLPPRGYGVYEEPIAASLRALGVPARGVRGMSLDALRDQVARGRPVVIWGVSGMRAPRAETLTDVQGRAFQAARGEHTFLVVGYDPGGIEVIDPATGRQRRVAHARFAASWAVLGRRAVVMDADSLASSVSATPGG